MSKIGKRPIEIPKDVKVEIEDNLVIVKGKKGELKREIRSEVEVKVAENQISVLPKIKTKKTKAFWGLTRALLANMVEGVSRGFEKKLQIEGLGYRAQMEGENLILYVGFSHPIKVSPPEGIKFSVEKNIISISGIDKELVGQTAAKIRSIRPPEPYKGKGIRYLGEKIRKKIGKKAATK